MGDFSHLNEHNEGSMVDIAAKAVTARHACVVGGVKVSQQCSRALSPEMIAEISSCARLAGVMAAKRTSELIPFCHPLSLCKVEIEIRFLENADQFTIRATSKTNDRTGVEMEALVGAQIAASTIYDMIKAVDPVASIGPFSLVEKSGGKKGHWTQQDD